MQMRKKHLLLGLIFTGFERTSLTGVEQLLEEYSRVSSSRQSSLRNTWNMGGFTFDHLHHLLEQNLSLQPHKISKVFTLSDQTRQDYKYLGIQHYQCQNGKLGFDFSLWQELKI